jgi:hypothetical protein
MRLRSASSELVMSGQPPVTPPEALWQQQKHAGRPVPTNVDWQKRLRNVILRKRQQSFGCDGGHD